VLNQLLKFTLASSLLIWLKPRWKGLLALGVAVVLVQVLHREYLGYVELSGDKSLLVWSYVIKWVALAGAVIAYLFLILFGSRKGPGESTQARAAQGSRGNPARADDGFDFLREKTHLQSRAEMIITEKAGEDGSR